jgi:ribosomal protein S27AE
MTNPNPRKPTMPTTLKCPYCVERGDFRVMSDHGNGGWYVCGRCGHLALRTNPQFVCTCAKCVGLRVA